MSRVTRLRMRTPRIVAVLGVTALALASCDHPIGVVTPHAEVADLVVRDSVGAELARTIENRSWTGGPLVVVDGTTARLLVNPLDFRDTEVPLADRRDLEIRMEAEDERLVQWEPQRGFGRLHGYATGTTRVRFMVWHGTHPDFVSPWLELRVREPSAGTVHRYRGTE